MFTKAISKDTKKALALLGRSRVVDRAYLAGGTAAALQLGHRISVDLDFFTPEEFDDTAVVNKLRKIGKFKLNTSNWRLISGRFNRVNIDLYLCHYPILFPFKRIYGVNILDIREIAAMKIAAITARSTKRDFIDLYFILKNVAPLKKLIAIYNKKFPGSENSLMQIQKSLVYFTDAEDEEMPKMSIPLNWEDVKRYFEEVVRKINTPTRCNYRVTHHINRK